MTGLGPPRTGTPTAPPFAAGPGRSTRTAAVERRRRETAGVPGPGAPAVGPSTSVGLFLFHTDPTVVAEAADAGVDGFIVDWERRGKARRQAGEGTQINHDTVVDLRRVRGATSAVVVCRLNGFGAWTGREIDRAVDAGADELLLPMVRTVAEVDRALELVAGRCAMGILVETEQGVAVAGELARRPLSRMYVGLNDLRIGRGSTELFAPLVDGTVDRIRELAGPVPFGVAGLTLPDRGAPVPSRLLAAELVRIRADFTFLRRSFLADCAGRPLAPAVAAIRAQLQSLAGRSSTSTDADRAELLGHLRSATARPA